MFQEINVEIEMNQMDIKGLIKTNFKTTSRKYRFELQKT